MGCTGEVEAFNRSAIYQYLNPINIYPGWALHPDFQINGIIRPGETSGEHAISCGNFKVGTGGKNHLTSLGPSANFSPVDLRWIIR